MKREFINEALVGAIIHDKVADIDRIVRSVEGDKVTAYAYTVDENGEYQNVDNDMVAFTSDAAILFRYVTGTADRKYPEGYSLNNQVLVKNGVKVQQGDLKFDEILGTVPGALILRTPENVLYTYDAERDAFSEVYDPAEDDDSLEASTIKFATLYANEDQLAIAMNATSEIAVYDENHQQTGTEEVTDAIEFLTFDFAQKPRRRARFHSYCVNQRNDYETLIGGTVVDGNTVLTFVDRKTGKQRITFGINGIDIPEVPKKVTRTYAGTTIEFTNEMLVNGKTIPFSLAGKYLIESYEDVLVFTNDKYEVSEVVVKHTDDRGDIVTLK